MKNCLLLVLLMACTFVPLKAQMNLVPNPSFEDVALCPNGLGQLYLANYWNNYGITPDIYCECGGFGVGVPLNNLGYQYAKSGNCMAGMMTFRKQNSPDGPNCREYLGIQLNQPLLAGNKYYFSSYINCSGGPSVVIGSNNIGMKLLTYEIDSTTGVLLITNSAIVFSDSIVTDTLNWFKISGSFIADSAYTHLVLGNFFDDLNTDTTSFQPGFIDYTYYYVDDICLSLDSTYCDTWTSNEEISVDESKLILFPNPVLSNLNISSELGIKSISIKNVLGNQLLHFEEITEASTILNLEKLNSGIFIIEINFGETIINRKIIKL
ncbi:MAG: T9SS type A sorting domain-containing protein [Bacteroidia bacterium]|jgi:hypothetical protein|nr:T9SS type A sorting domain-containing protein [Bacteroidia bacterium]